MLLPADGHFHGFLVFLASTIQEFRDSSEPVEVGYKRKRKDNWKKAHHTPAFQVNLTWTIVVSEGCMTDKSSFLLESEAGGKVCTFVHKKRTWSGNCNMHESV